MKMRSMMWISFLFITACATPPPAPSTYHLTPNPAATLAAVDLTRQQAANAATVVAAESTRQSTLATQQAVQATQTAQLIATGTAHSIALAQTATTESITLQVTEQALSSQATFSAIAAHATGTAVSQAALAEQHLVEDEAQRLALQREAETAVLEYQRTMNHLKPYLWGGVVVALILLATGFTYLLYQRSRPITVHDSSGPRVLIPANSWQVLPNGRLPALLPATTQPTTPDNQPIPLPPLTYGHVLIAGETGSGKSTALLAILKRRQQVVVLDPHSTPGSWGDAQVIGGGRDFTAIGHYMQQMRHLLTNRYAQRAQGMTQFEPLTVATDEMPAIIAALGSQVDEVWREWLREGRKVGLFFVVSTQSTRVKTLGIRGEGDLLENFTYVLVLGKLATTLYPTLAQPMERPAILRMVRGVRPVLIPNELPETHTSTTSNPVMMPPFDATDYADPFQLTETTRQRIQQLAKELPSQAAIERTVFGYNGGAAYRAVKEVLNGSTTSQPSQ